MRELPHLIAEHPCLRWKAERTDVAFVPYDVAQDAAATHAYAVPFVARDGCIATRRSSGRWTLPGGTRKGDETWHDTLGREILEETGCAIDEYEAFGAFRVDDGQSHSFRIVCMAAVRRVQPAADPDGAQGIVEVREVPIAQAPGLFDRELIQYGAVYAIAGTLWSSDATWVGRSMRNHRATQQTSPDRSEGAPREYFRSPLGSAGRKRGSTSR